MGLLGQLLELPRVAGATVTLPVFLPRDAAMDDLGENTTVLSSLRSLNSFISQRAEGGPGLGVSASAPGSLQLQYQQNMQVSVVAEGAPGEGALPRVQLSALGWERGLSGRDPCPQTGWVPESRGLVLVLTRCPRSSPLA